MTVVWRLVSSIGTRILRLIYENLKLAVDRLSLEFFRQEDENEVLTGNIRAVYGTLLGNVWPDDWERTV
jgi:hypothetical protein